LSNWARPRLDPYGTESLNPDTTLAYTPSRYGEIYGPKTKDDKDRLIADLLAIHDPETDTPVLARVIDMADHYSPEYVQRGAPDLCLEFVTPDVQPYPDLGPDNQVWEIHPKEIGGDHDALGVFLLKGPGIQGSESLPETVHIVDIYPTVCALLGLPIPNNVDGNPVLGPQSGQETLPIPESLEEPEAHASLGLEEEEQIQARLRSLGYL
jgi:hypothetical protein